MRPHAEGDAPTFFEEQIGDITETKDTRKEDFRVEVAEVVNHIKDILNLKKGARDSGNDKI